MIKTVFAVFLTFVLIGCGGGGGSGDVGGNGSGESSGNGSSATNGVQYGYEVLGVNDDGTYKVRVYLKRDTPCVSGSIFYNKYLFLCIKVPLPASHKRQFNN